MLKSLTLLRERIANYGMRDRDHVPTDSRQIHT